jgi:hypothetical protein
LFLIDFPSINYDQLIAVINGAGQSFSVNALFQFGAVEGELITVSGFRTNPITHQFPLVAKANHP